MQELRGDFMRCGSTIQSGETQILGIGTGRPILALWSFNVTATSWADFGPPGHTPKGPLMVVIMGFDPRGAKFFGDC